MLVLLGVVLFKQKTAYEMRISDWSSDVCSSDLPLEIAGVAGQARQAQQRRLSLRPRIAAVVQPQAVLRPPICVFIFRHYLIPVASSTYRCDESVKRQPHARRFSAGKAHLLAGRGFLRRRGACELSRACSECYQGQGGGRNRDRTRVVWGKRVLARIK